jgi:murein DD-endopeptidase MepM/ murein hydrolase activator NlpD
VREGQRVGRGLQVGRSGSTGWSTGAHLHFEVLVDGEFSDPALWL